jgi:hypothetical protein
MGHQLFFKMIYKYGGLAQLGEHLPYKQRVGGSIPSSSTKDFCVSKISFFINMPV